jgi:hypothetical protein
MGEECGGRTFPQERWVLDARPGLYRKCGGRWLLESGGTRGFWKVQSLWVASVYGLSMRYRGDTFGILIDSVYTFLI